MLPLALHKDCEHLTHIGPGIVPIHFAAASMKSSTHRRKMNDYTEDDDDNDLFEHNDRHKKSNKANNPDTQIPSVECSVAFDFELEEDFDEEELWQEVGPLKRKKRYKTTKLMATEYFRLSPRTTLQLPSLLEQEVFQSQLREDLFFIQVVLSRLYRRYCRL